jgi:hypothetical protein
MRVVVSPDQRLDPGQGAVPQGDPVILEREVNLAPDEITWHE